MDLRGSLNEEGRGTLRQRRRHRRTRAALVVAEIAAGAGAAGWRGPPAAQLLGAHAGVARLRRPTICWSSNLPLSPRRYQEDRAHGRGRAHDRARAARCPACAARPSPPAADERQRARRFTSTAPRSRRKGRTTTSWRAIARSAPAIWTTLGVPLRQGRMLDRARS